MFKLIANENAKIYRRLRTWILLFVMILGVVVTAWIMHSTEQPNPNWRQALIVQTNSMQHEIQSGSAHMPAAAVTQIKQQIQMNQYYISNNINPGQTTAWTFAVETKNLDPIVMAFILVIAGDIVASEFASGTIKMLLTQTATRSKILLSKYIAAMLYALFMSLVLVGASILIGGLFFGFQGLHSQSFYVNAHSTIVGISEGARLLMTFGFWLVQLLMTVTIAFTISTIFRSSALAITLSILSYLVGNTLVAFLSSFSWDKFILFTNTNLEQYFVGGPFIKGMTLTFSVVMLAVYLIVMILLSFGIFAKRDVSYS